MAVVSLRFLRAVRPVSVAENKPTQIADEAELQYYFRMNCDF